MTSLRRRDGALEARIVNETDEGCAFSFGAEQGELRPWEIRTLTL